MTEWIDELKALEGVPISFSRFCVSGLVPQYAARCECWRCRKARGESTDETLAENVSVMATEKFRKDRCRTMANPRQNR